MYKPFLTFSVLILTVIGLVAWGLKGFVGEKVDLNDRSVTARYGEKFSKACIAGAEKKYVKMGREPTAEKRGNFSKACGCLWDGMVAAGKKLDRPMTLSRLQEELKADGSYDAVIERCAELYPIMPK